MTVQAGVRLRDLERALAPARQSVALFPPRPAYAGTVGGLIATNAAGSHRYRFGTPRDRLTGITAVRADGTIVASADPAAFGGRDLITLLAGSFGSLGLITEATFRLEPTPQVSGSMALNCDDPEHAERLMEEVSDPSIAPLGIDLRWPSADEQLRLFVMIQGDREDFEARAGAGVRAGGPSGSAAHRPCSRSPPRRPRSRRAPGGRGAAAAGPAGPDPGRDRGPSAGYGDAGARLVSANAAGRDADPDPGGGGRQRGRGRDRADRPIVGVLDVKVPAETPAAAVARFVAALRAGLGGLSRGGDATPAARAVVVYAPDDVRDLTDAHGPVPSLALLLAVKDEFDPEHRMAPGRLADAV